MIHQGTGETIVLLHGATSSCNTWKHVVPLLSPSNEVFAFTALGHRGGNKATSSIEISDIIDDFERLLDKYNIDKPHITGNSMGGWAAIELAKRGRAASVCAISPAGFWNTPQHGQHLALKKLKRLAFIAKITQPLLPLLAKSSLIRMLALKDVAKYGNKLSGCEFTAMVEDMLYCEVKSSLFNTKQSLNFTKPLPCPCTLVWPECDLLFPPNINAVIAKERLPDARSLILKDIGHVPMIDDPLLIATTILKSIEYGKAFELNE
ncbi:hypothetical protein AMS58_08605 [Pseudoalteromonas porphyrae]|uniref:alpha/beta fold hydrolase n=1 Tax=Pseudoalteromonas TaxID=53246 RepID=UPI0006BB0813|nr:MULTISPECIES: alpha/beta hydrolase [Pseudoalteromonas]KPH94972.1 hypothetical protein AMS58_08605 [Pseudoalteromonas porphyrae]